MLQPDYFADKADRMVALYQQLEDWILKDIARRIVKTKDLPATADRLIWKLEQMGEHKAVILKKLSRLTGLAEKELKKLLQGAVLTSWKDDAASWDELGIPLSAPLDNAAVIAVMDAEYKKSLGELRNLTNTTLTDSSTALGRMLDEVEMRVASGVQSYDAAIADVIDRFASQGAYVTYPTGRKMSLESAVRMIVVTSMNQTAAQVSNQYVLEAGTNYVLVSAHYGARIRKKGQPELAGHDLWQGMTYSIRGNEPGYPNLLESTGYDIDPVTGAGRVVNPLGLHGYNCRHSHKPWDKRLRNPWRDEEGNLIDGNGNRITSEENKRIYELQQKQRSMERGIRQTKRRLMAKAIEVEGAKGPDAKEALQAEYASLSDMLIRQNKAYNDFCEQNKLKPDYARTKTPGWGRSEAAKANAAAKRGNAHKKLGVGNSGGGAGKTTREELGKINAEKSEEALEYFGKQIKDEKVENAIVIDQKGGVYRFVGDERGVDIYDVDLEGAYITHNHPEKAGNVSFGEDDFYFLRAHQGIAVLECVNSKYRYRIRVLKSMDEVVYNDIYLEGMKYSKEKGFEIQDSAMKVLAERGYVTYEKWRIEDG